MGLGQRGLLLVPQDGAVDPVAGVDGTGEVEDVALIDVLSRSTPLLEPREPLLDGLLGQGAIVVAQHAGPEPLGSVEVAVGVVHATHSGHDCANLFLHGLKSFLLWKRPGQDIGETFPPKSHPGIELVLRPGRRGLLRPRVVSHGLLVSLQRGPGPELALVLLVLVAHQERGGGAGGVAREDVLREWIHQDALVEVVVLLGRAADDEGSLLAASRGHDDREGRDELAIGVRLQDHRDGLPLLDGLDEEHVHLGGQVRDRHVVDGLGEDGLALLLDPLDLGLLVSLPDLLVLQDELVREGLQDVGGRVVGREGRGHHVDAGDGSLDGHAVKALELLDGVGGDGHRRRTSSVVSCCSVECYRNNPLSFAFHSDRIGRAGAVPTVL